MGDVTSCTKYPLNTPCKNCKRTFGWHGASDPLCPADDVLDDAPGTRFEPRGGDHG